MKGRQGERERKAEEGHDEEEEEEGCEFLVSRLVKQSARRLLALGPLSLTRIQIVFVAYPAAIVPGCAVVLEARDVVPRPG